MRKLIALIVAALLSLSGPGAAGPWEDGLAAYKRQDYETVLRLWRPLADRGDASAQYSLGLMYQNGQGVPLDCKIARNSDPLRGGFRVQF